MQYDFFFWWSLISTILSIIFLITAIWQLFEGKKQQAQHKSQVKIWMQEANGLQQSLRRIVQDNLDKRYGSTDDIANTIWAIQANSFSLYQSLYEERCVTEEDYADEQKELREQFKAQSANLQPLKNSTKTKK